MEVTPEKVEAEIQQNNVSEAIMRILNFATQTVAGSAMIPYLLSISQIFSFAQMIPFVIPVAAMPPVNVGPTFFYFLYVHSQLKSAIKALICKYCY